MKYIVFIHIYIFQCFFLDAHLTLRDLKKAGGIQYIVFIHIYVSVVVGRLLHTERS